MDSNASDQSKSQTGRTLTSRPAQTHQPNGSTSSRAALNPKTKSTKPPSTSRFSLGSLKKPQPAVFWNDKKSLDQGPQRTFYNDMTPPPSPSYAGGDRKDSFSIGYPSFGKTPPIGEERGHTGTTNGGDGYDYRYDYVAPQAPIPKKGPIGGLKRKTFWGILIGIIVVLVLALAIGLGVGLGGKGGGSGGGDSDESNDNNDPSDDNRPIETTTTTVLYDPTSTFTSPPEQTTTTTHGSTVCPAANNTSFDVPSSPHTFLRLCGVDYPSSGGTEDIAIVWTASIQDCMIYCAGYDGCKACAWGVLPGDNYKDNHRCYLKTDLETREEARDGWDFAIMQD